MPYFRSSAPILSKMKEYFKEYRRTVETDEWNYQGTYLKCNEPLLFVNQLQTLLEHQAFIPGILDKGEQGADIIFYLIQWMDLDWAEV